MGSFPDTKAGDFYRAFRLLGTIRMRQVRVKQDSCGIPAELRYRVGRCHAALSPHNFTGKSNEDTIDYGPTVNDSSRPAFQWYSAEALKDNVFYGRSWQRCSPRSSAPVLSQVCMPWS